MLRNSLIITMLVGVFIALAAPIAAAQDYRQSYGSSQQRSGSTLTSQIPW